MPKINYFIEGIKSGFVIMVLKSKICCESKITSCKTRQKILFNIELSFCSLIITKNNRKNSDNFFEIIISEVI
jgi:hypothetical protein